MHDLKPHSESRPSTYQSARSILARWRLWGAAQRKASLPLHHLPSPLKTPPTINTH